MDSFKCSSCGDSNERLYSCDSCPVDSNECSNEFQKELFCDLCVVPHVKKGHDVKTVKGQVSMICDTHKMLHSLYCKTCDITFCAKCATNRTKHDLGEVVERASEIRKELFEILTTSEKTEKPLRMKKESVIEQKVRHSSEQDQLKENFLKEVENVRKAGISMIETNYKIFAEKEKTVVDAIEKVVDLQQETRNVLSLDDCQLILDVKKLTKDAKYCEKKSKSVLADNFECESCDISVVERELQSCTENLTKNLRSKIRQSELPLDVANESSRDIHMISSEVKRQEFERYAFDLELNSPTARCTVKGGKLAIEEVSSVGSGKINPARLLYSQSLDKNIKMVYFDQQMSTVILQTSSDSFIQVRKRNKIDQSKKVELHLMNGFICPYIGNESFYELLGDDYLGQCYWDENLKLVRFTRYDMCYKCENKPMLISSQVYPFVCLLTQNNDIMILKVDECDHYEIPRNVHKMHSIEYVNFSKPNLTDAALFAWSYEMKIVSLLLCRRVDFNGRREWVLTHQVSWSSQPLSTFVHVFGSIKIWLFSAEENKSGKASQNVYAVIKA